MDQLLSLSNLINLAFYLLSVKESPTLNQNWMKFNVFEITLSKMLKLIVRVCLLFFDKYTQQNEQQNLIF